MKVYRFLIVILIENNGGVLHSSSTMDLFTKNKKKPWIEMGRKKTFVGNE